MASWYGFTLGIHRPLNIVHPTIKFTSDISDTEISFLDLTIHIQQPQLHTRLYTKTTDRHMYLRIWKKGLHDHL